MAGIGFALALNLHQPSGNLEYLLDHEEWEAKEILWAMDRIPRALWGYEDVARVHLALSGTLLETLSSPAFQERVYGIVDCGIAAVAPAEHRLVQSSSAAPTTTRCFPLIPPQDWPAQLQRWQGLGGHLFRRGASPASGRRRWASRPSSSRCWRALGYRYVVVDSNHVEPVGPMSWQELRYRPHVARFGDSEIVVVVRDRDLSNAQESGMEVDWFLGEVAARTQHCDFPPLVTTCTDGDNGGWFRNTGHNFWTAFYQPLLDRVRAGREPRRGAGVHRRLPRPVRRARRGDRSAPVPGTPAGTTAPASCSGRAPPRSGTRSRVSAN